MHAAREQGALLYLAHPNWTGNTIEGGLRHPFDGVEIYNHTSHCEIGKGTAFNYWDMILENRSVFTGIAADDAHFPPGEPFWKGGWIMVNAVRNTAIELLAAIKAGKFYSSQGPEFQSIKLDGQRLEIETTPVKFARLIGPRNLGKWAHFTSEYPTIRRKISRFRESSSIAIIVISAIECCGVKIVAVDVGIHVAVTEQSLNWTIRQGRHAFLAVDKPIPAIQQHRYQIIVIF